MEKTCVDAGQDQARKDVQVRYGLLQKVSGEISERLLLTRFKNTFIPPLMCVCMCVVV